MRLLTVCFRISVCVAAGVLPSAVPASATTLPVIDTPEKPVPSNYHGTAVQDPFQWLEKVNDPEVQAWTQQQNERTRGYFAPLLFHEGIAQQLMQIRSEESARYFSLDERKGRIFALRFKPPAQQPVLVRFSSLEPPALYRTVFDPNAYNTNGTTAIDWFVPSLDGQKVAICLSEGGSEQGTMHFVDANTGKEIAEEIPRVQFPTAGGSAAWTTDGMGVLYTRYPQKGERPDADLNFFQQVWYHRLGSPISADKLELGADFPRIAEIALDSSEDGQWVIATVANGDGGDYAHYIRNAAGTWRQITKFEDEIKHGKIGRDNALYLLSRKNAPTGKVLRMDLQEPNLSKAMVVVPEGKEVIQELAPSDKGLYVSEIYGGPFELKYYERGSKKGLTLPTLPISTVADVQSWHGDQVVYGNVSYVEPFAWYQYEPGTKQPQRTALHTISPVDFNDIEVTREFAVSKDGTKVPLNILKRKNTRLDGSNPTLLYGYGGYGVNMTPAFDPTRRIWFDAGGIYVVANIRGGGEYGEHWHKQGNLTLKQNVFDDFIAAAEHLIKRGYTSTAKLAVEGGSNGGLLMGAFLTQRPDLARAVVSHVGIYDMVRVELEPNGQFNVTEFGTVKDPEQFKALYAYSPYHHVRDSEKYPAVLLATGENDGRVNPSQSRKMAARLQKSTSSGLPILFRSTATAGHGIGSSLRDRIALQADVYTFLFNELGINSSKWRLE